MIVLGSAWMRNAAYLDAIRIVKYINKLSLVSAIYDVNQFKNSLIYPNETTSDFTDNCTHLIEIYDLIITGSKASSLDIVEMCIAKRIPIPPLKIFRLGDEAVSIDPLGSGPIDVRGAI